MIEKYLNYQQEYRVLIFVILMLFVLAGFLWDLYIKKSRQPHETLTNFMIYAVQTVIILLMQEIQLQGFLYFEKFQWLTIPQTWVTFFICFMCMDFIYYWRHRIEHRLNFFWAEHSVHHSSEEFNLSTAIRLPWIAPVFGWIFFIPLVAVGFSAVFVFNAYFLVFIYQFWIHNNYIPRLGWFDSVFNSPSNHRVHHAKNIEYLDKNYGATFMIWDRLFGTYEAEVCRPEFGITDPINTRNPLKVNWKPYAIMLCTAAQKKTPLSKLSILFKGPEALMKESQSKVL